ncbi:MAG: phospho-sugar mutase [Clostridia bacterium]|nr:phospho-sugar mutase [Clostridia bacterium]
MTIKEKLELWKTFDDETAAELSAITDEKEIEDRFYKDLEFGTGGLRGIMGAGANRMNRYTIGKATQGLADYLKATCAGEISASVAYDSRNNSREFALRTAGVLAANGIKVYLFETLEPTPVLSFSVRYHKCDAGVVVTASHNPKEYNGYKAYDNKGCQLVPELANKVIGYVNAVEDLKAVPCMKLDEAVSKGLIVMIGKETVDAFLKEVRKQTLYTEKSDLKIVYTPLHGTGNIPVREILRDFNVSVVKEQELPDGNFSTVRSPNPEEKDALTLALEQAQREGADLVIGTDPDCDRVGIGVKHNGKFTLMTGNQTGALLVDFVLSMKKDSLNEKSTVVKTIVTSELGANIAKSYGLNVVETLTGFKYIGEQICLYEQNGSKEYVFGYEESYGYLAGTHARDKDAVVASYLIAQMAAYHKNRGKDLIEVLEEIYAKYGYYLDCLDNIVLKGKDGAERIKELMEIFRSSGKTLLDDVKEEKDYAPGIDGLPKENVLKYFFNDGSWIAIRPSGTEPKLKIYYSIRGESFEAAQAKRDAIKAKLDSVING